VCTLIAHRVHRHRTRVVVVSRVVCIYMSARPTPQVVVVKVAKKNEQKKKKSSSCAAFVKSRPHVKAQFPRDILNACERFQSEFELRATLDYDAKSRRRPEDDSDDLSSTLTKKLRLREVFPEEDVSDASIAFLERDIEAVVRDFRDHAFVGVKESDDDDDDDGSSWKKKKKKKTKKVVVSLSLLRRTLCTKLHVDHVRMRAMTTYCGKKTEVLDEESLVHAIVAKAATVDENAGPMARALRPVADALKSNAKVFEKTLVKERGESCDILFLKGEMWESGKASVHRSPETTNGGWRLVLRVDEYDAVNEAEEHQMCVVDDEGRGREE